MSYLYLFLIVVDGQERTFTLEIFDRREFLVRVLRRLPMDRGLRWETLSDQQAVPDASAEGSEQIVPELRRWLAGFLPASEIDKILGPAPVDVPIPNCS